MRNILLFAIVAVLGTSCTTVPALISHDEARSQYVGKPVSVLYDEFGLPDLERESTDGVTTLMTWFQGTSNDGMAVHWGYGIYTHTGQNKQNKMTAEISPTGFIVNVDTNGYDMGNSGEVQAAQANNALWGSIGILGVLSLLLSL